MIRSRGSRRSPFGIVPGSKQTLSKRWWYRLAAGLLITALLLGVQLGPAANVPGLNPALPHASATPKPGDPGGNSSKPGDNKKKKKDDDKKNERPSRSTSKDGPREPHTEYEGRRGDGSFSSNNSGRDGSDEEELGFQQFERQTGENVIRRKIRVTITDDDGVKRTREYDGLVEVTDDSRRPGELRRFIGIEHKVTGANKTKNQKIVDKIVSTDRPARGRLDGDPVEIVGYQDLTTDRISSPPGTPQDEPPPQPEAPQAVTQQAPVVTATPEIPTNRPVEAPPLQISPEAPPVRTVPEVPATRVPVEMPPVSVAPQTPVNIPEAPVTAIPRPSVAPQIGVPAAPTGAPAPPQIIIPTPTPVGVPRLPAWSTPPPGPVLVPKGADSIASLQAEQNALDVELNTLIDRVEALQATPGLNASPDKLTELDGLRRLQPLIVNRQEAISGALAQVPPPKTAWDKTISAIDATADTIQDVVVQTGVAVLGALRKIRFVPVP